MEYNTGTFDILESYNWYKTGKLNIHERVSLEMEREASIAFGHFYRVGCYTEETKVVIFERLKRLVNSRNEKQKEIAFHMIRHTVLTGGAKKVLVSSEFHPLLRKLAHDRTLKRITKRFNSFFKYNLKNS